MPAPRTSHFVLVYFSSRALVALRSTEIQNRHEYITRSCYLAFFAQTHKLQLSQQHSLQLAELGLGKNKLQKKGIEEIDQSA